LYGIDNGYGYYSTFGDVYAYGGYVVDSEWQYGDAYGW
jgi:hypothetical protein